MSTFNDLYMFLSTDDVKNNGKHVMELSAKALLGDLESLKELCENNKNRITILPILVWRKK